MHEKNNYTRCIFVATSSILDKIWPTKDCIKPSDNNRSKPTTTIAARANYKYFL